MVDELNLAVQDDEDDGEQFYASDEEIRKRQAAHEVVGAGLGATGKVKGSKGHKQSGLGMAAALNEDSDLDLDENDGQLVGGSQSDKGDVL